MCDGVLIIHSPRQVLFTISHPGSMNACRALFIVTPILSKSECCLMLLQCLILGLTLSLQEMGLLAATFAMSEMLEESETIGVGKYYNACRSLHNWNDNENDWVEPTSAALVRVVCL